MSPNRLKLNEHISHADMPLHTSLVRVRHDVGNHDHDFIEIALILQGSARHETLYDHRDIKQADVIILRPGVWHAYRQCHRLHVGNCGIGLALRQRELAWTQSDPHLGYLLWSGPWAGDQQGVIYGRMKDDATRQAAGHLKKLNQLVNAVQSPPRALILAQLLMYLNKISMAWDSTIPEQKQSDPIIHPAVHDAIVLLEHHADQQWTLTALAQRVQLDPAYLTRLFTTHCGRPPMAYLNRLRLERAAGMLLRSDHPIGQIAAKVGMPDANYFTRRFGKHFGITPTQMRSRHHASES